MTLTIITSKPIIVLAVLVIKMLVTSAYHLASNDNYQPLSTTIITTASITRRPRTNNGPPHYTWSRRVDERRRHLKEEKEKMILEFEVSLGGWLLVKWVDKQTTVGYNQRQREGLPAIVGWLVTCCMVG